MEIESVLCHQYFVLQQPTIFHESGGNLDKTFQGIIQLFQVDVVLMFGHSSITSVY